MHADETLAKSPTLERELQQSICLPAGRQRILLPLCWMLLLAYCFLGSVAMVVQSSRLINSPHETTFPEAANVYLAILAGHSGHLYQPFSSPPNVVQPYGPLFYAVNMEIARFSNFDVNSVTRLGRLFSFTSYILCGLLVYLISRRFEFSKLEAALAASMLLAQPAFLFWNATFRADMATLLAMLLSLFIVIRKETDDGWRSAVSGFVAAVALLVKASAIVIPLAILAVWLLGKKYKSCLIFIAGAAVPVLATFVFLLWHKEQFASQFVSAGKSIWSIASGARWMFSRRSEATLWAPLAMGAFGCKAAIQSDEDSQMAVSFFLCSLFVGLATISQVAGDANYFQAALAGSALLLPFAIREIRYGRTSALLEAAALVVLLAASSGLVAESYHLRFVPPRTHERWSELGRYKVLSDWPQFSSYGRDPEYLDPQAMHLMELTGNWESSSFVRRIRSGDFDIILLLEGQTVRSYRGVAFFGRSEIAAINSSYEPLCSVGPMLVLRSRFHGMAATPEVLTSILGKPCLANREGPFPNLTLDRSAR